MIHFMVKLAQVINKFLRFYNIKIQIKKLYIIIKFTTLTNIKSSSINVLIIITELDRPRLVNVMIYMSYNNFNFINNV